MAVTPLPYVLLPSDKFNKQTYIFSSTFQYEISDLPVAYVRVCLYLLSSSTLSFILYCYPKAQLFFISIFLLRFSDFLFSPFLFLSKSKLTYLNCMFFLVLQWVPRFYRSVNSNCESSQEICSSLQLTSSRSRILLLGLLHFILQRTYLILLRLY